MTIKQLFIGILVGSSAAALMIHRLHKTQAASSYVSMAHQTARTVHARRHVASAKKTEHPQRFPPFSDSQLSSRTLYGKHSN